MSEPKYKLVMVDRFLSWPLPKDFAPDGGVSFTPLNNPSCWPTGTNLLTAEQARSMIEHMLGGTAIRRGDLVHVCEGPCTGTRATVRLTDGHEALLDLDGRNAGIVVLLEHCMGVA